MGGAFIVDTIDAATGINLWREWAKVDVAGEGGDYAVPAHRRDYAGIVLSLARQEEPDLSAYNDPEVVTTIRKHHHAGVIVSSPDPQRIEALIGDYTPALLPRLLRDCAAAGAPGRVIKRTLKNVWSPERRNRRDVDVYLPASYSAGRSRYPVVYMHDGQNLSDPGTAFAGTWELDATLERLAGRGIEAIVVGVHNVGADRLAEVQPVSGSTARGRRCRCLSGVSRPVAQAAHRPDVSHPARARRHGDARIVDGRARQPVRVLPLSVGIRAGGVMSPSIWFGQGAVLDFIEEARTPPGRLYLDVGTHEGAGTLQDARRAGRLLVKKGFARDRRARRVASDAAGPERRTTHEGKPRLRYVEHAGGRHNEADWASRLEGALEFLLR